MRKKVISLSFDDGREDLYRNAFPIMQKYGLVSTAHVTTGFIDGTFKPLTWRSCTGAATVEQLLKMKSCGHEISSHGDRHITDIDDFDISVRKLVAMNLAESDVGFAVPHSNTRGAGFGDFVNHLKSHERIYVRGGERKSTLSFFDRAFIKLATILDKRLGSNWCFRMLNWDKAMDLDKEVPRYLLPSVLVHSYDEPRKLIGFIESLPDNVWLIIMLHSILNLDEPHYGADLWCWSTDKFEKFCEYLFRRQSEGCLSVKTIAQQLECINDVRV